MKHWDIGCRRQSVYKLCLQTVSWLKLCKYNFLILLVRSVVQKCSNFVSTKNTIKRNTHTKIGLIGGLNRLSDISMNYVLAIKHFYKVFSVIRVSFAYVCTTTRWTSMVSYKLLGYTTREHKAWHVEGYLMSLEFVRTDNEGLYTWRAVVS